MVTDISNLKTVLLRHDSVGSVYLNATDVNWVKTKNLIVFDQSLVESQFGSGAQTIVSDFLQIRETFIIDGFFYDDVLGSSFNKMMDVGSMIDAGGFAYLKWGDVPQKQVNFTVYRASESANEFDKYGFHLELVGGSAL